MKVKFYGGSKDGLEQDYKDPEAGYNLTVVAALYHPYCPQVDQEIYDMEKDGNLYVRPSETQPCQQCSVIKNDKIKMMGKRQKEIDLHRAVCKCDYCGIEDSYDF